MTTPDSTPVSVESVMARAYKLHHAIMDSDKSTEIAKKALRAEVERLAAQSAPTAAQVEPSARAAPGGCMTDAVEIPVEAVIERLSFLADNDEHGSAIARQTLKRAAELLDFYHIMALPEAGVDDELRALGIDPDKAGERAGQAIQSAIDAAQAKAEDAALTEGEIAEVLAKNNMLTIFSFRIAFRLGYKYRAHLSKRIPADGEVRPTQEQGQDAAPAEQPQDDEPTWQELEDFRKRHWTHWNAADNLLIAHLAQKLKCAARPAAQPGAQEPAK